MERKGVERNTPSHFRPLFTLFLREHPPPLKRQQLVRASPARLAVLMFKMAPVTNYRTAFPGASVILAAEFFPCFAAGACRGCTKGPTSSGLKGKHLQSCWTPLSFSINVTLPALVRDRWAEAGKTLTESPLKLLKVFAERFTGWFLTHNLAFRLQHICDTARHCAHVCISHQPVGNLLWSG